MDFFRFLGNVFGIKINEEDNSTCYRKATKDPLILSLRKIPRNEIEEPEVEYISISVDDNINKEVIIDAEVLE